MLSAPRAGQLLSSGSVRMTGGSWAVGRYDAHSIANGAVKAARDLGSQVQCRAKAKLVN